MGKFVLKRLASMVITLWMIATIVFMIVNVLPGDVDRKVLGATANRCHRVVMGLCDVIDPEMIELAPGHTSKLPPDRRGTQRAPP